MNNQISNDELNGLIEKSKCGDVQAFEKIVRSFQKYGLAVSLRILCNQEDAKDVVQESFIKIWKHMKSYDSRAKFTTWMYKIIVNLCYDKLKHRKRKQNQSGSIDDELEGIELADPGDLEKEFSNKETAALIKYFSAGLSEKQKIIFVLRDLEELTIKEVEEITGLSESAIKTNLFLARQNIRNKIIGLEK